MTIAMGRLHALLDNSECYPLPPPEIVERVAIASDKQDARTSRLLAHFSFGALTGSVFALLPMRRGSGILHGRCLGAQLSLMDTWPAPAIRALLLAAQNRLRSHLSYGRAGTEHAPDSCVKHYPVSWLWRP
jgi:hypothetical protein